MSSVVGIDVGGTGIKIARVDADGMIESQVVIPTPSSDVEGAVRAGAAKLATSDVVAIGVVVPGTIDRVRGVVEYSSNINWRDVPLRSLLMDDLGVPVDLDNDVTAAALAESDHVEGDLFYVALGTGIGGAHVCQSTAMRGVSDMAGEIGHIPVWPDGESCPCGQRGCLEVYASATGLVRRYRAAGGGQASTAYELAQRLDDDPIAERVWNDAVVALGLGLATTVLLLDPHRVVLGGGLAGAGQRLLGPVRTELAARLSWRPAPPLHQSALGRDGGVFGAARLARALVPSAQRAIGTHFS